MIGDWGSVSYVHTSRRDYLTASLTALLEREGYSLVHTHGPLPALDDSTGHFAPYLRVAIIGYRGPWTAIKMSDSEFMCRRSEGRKRCRLSELAVALRRYAFQVSVEGDGSMTLLEASKSGRVCVSGGLLATGSRQFHGERIRRKHHFALDFYLLRVNANIAERCEDSQGIASVLVPGIEPDIVATDWVFRALGEPPTIPHARWMAFARKHPITH